MSDVRYQFNDLSAAQVVSTRKHKLHRVRLFAPAVCRVEQGSKIIVQGARQMSATTAELIVLPADIDMEVINQPAGGRFCSRMLSLSADILALFRERYVLSPVTAKMTSWCVPADRDLLLMWHNALRSVETDSSPEMRVHQVHGLLLALYQAGYGWPLLRERHASLTDNVRQVVMLAPAENWSVKKVAGQLHMGESTLRRRLQQESSSFRTLVEEVRMAYALTRLQTTALPIGEIAHQCGYLSPSRFTARFQQHYGLLPRHVR
ncbi:helix-turn-helix transcriptional regulator [Entomohabitans teleogrylli]|uniref:helix-turn-helix transcriptional regulator n=1 Tax=Entomohabitans teleogrylli TaxID=1384589 RepID=UPI00073D6FE2|nr:helix-turn-helix transcriptional regulator [Entomohabitans teleogrylli]